MQWNSLIQTGTPTFSYNLLHVRVPLSHSGKFERKGIECYYITKLKSKSVLAMILIIFKG